MPISWSSIEEVPNCFFVFFWGHPSNFKITRDKYHQFWAELSVSGLSLQFEFTDGFEMIYKAWSSIEDVPYCFSSRSSIKFQGHTGQKIASFDQNWAFLDCNSTLNSPMGLKWCTKLDQSGTKPKLVAFLMATNFGHFLLFLLPKLVVF